MRKTITLNSVFCKTRIYGEHHWGIISFVYQAIEWGTGQWWHSSIIPESDTNFLVYHAWNVSRNCEVFMSLGLCWELGVDRNRQKTVMRLDIRHLGLKGVRNLSYFIKNVGSSPWRQGLRPSRGNPYSWKYPSILDDKCPPLLGATITLLLIFGR